MALLEVKDLRKVFGGLTAVNDLTFKIEQGKLVSIIGPNGAGKSTLFNLLTGAYQPSAGKVIFNGKDITGCRPYQSARLGMGRTFQNTAVFGQETVLDNVIVGQSLHMKTTLWGAVLGTGSARREETKVREKARSVLDFVGLGDLESKMAGGLTEEAQKRLSIAMVLVADPLLLLLDEPTGGVNLEEIGGLIDLARKIQQLGITICLIEHKMRMVMSMSDHIIVLNYGTNIAEGSPEQVANNQKVIEAYLGARRVA
jgi:branched-chain amino acid transport system ATP-binding protein